jgi:predicted alpha/beta hydrolase
LLLGHSVGGQLLGLAPSAGRLRGALLVGAQNGHWKHGEGGARLRIWLSWHVVLPALTSALGYAPMGVLRLGEDLPAGVARQWARWGRHPEHLLSECSVGEREAYRRLGFPIRSYHFTDDAFAPRRAVEALAAVYRGSTAEVVTRAPADVETSSIGHFGWLKPAFRETLWREMAAWLLARVDAVSSQAQGSNEGSRSRTEAVAKRGPLGPAEEASTHVG